MGMESLRCQSPDMAEKELLAYLVAHNLIRCVMAEAVAQHAVALERVSFKGSVDALRVYSEMLGRARNKTMRRQLWENLLADLAGDLVRHRPNRTEPRAVKRRPKPYPLLNQPRRSAGVGAAVGGTPPAGNRSGRRATAPRRVSGG